MEVCDFTEWKKIYCDFIARYFPPQLFDIKRVGCQWNWSYVLDLNGKRMGPIMVEDVITNGFEGWQRGLNTNTTTPTKTKQTDIVGSCPSATHHGQVPWIYTLAEMPRQEEHADSHSSLLQRQWIQVLTTLLHLLYFICIFPYFHWRIQIEPGTFSATEELITAVKIFCLPHTQRKSKIRLSPTILKIGIGKEDWTHSRAFHIQAACKSYWTLALNASILLYESSLHPTQGQPSRKQAFVGLSLLFPLFSYTCFSSTGHLFFLSPWNFLVLFLYYPLLLFWYKATAVLVPLVALALVSVYFFWSEEWQVLTGTTRLFIPPVSLCFYTSRGSRKQRAFIPCMVQAASPTRSCREGLTHPSWKCCSCCWRQGRGTAATQHHPAAPETGFALYVLSNWYGPTETLLSFFLSFYILQAINLTQLWDWCL